MKIFIILISAFSITTSRKYDADEQRQLAAQTGPSQGLMEHLHAIQTESRTQRARNSEDSVKHLRTKGPVAVRGSKQNPDCVGVKKPGCVLKQEYDPATGEPLFPMEQREVGFGPERLPLEINGPLFPSEQRGTFMLPQPNPDKPRVKPDCNGVKKPGCVLKQEYDPMTGEPLFPMEQREVGFGPERLPLETNGPLFPSERRKSPVLPMFQPKRNKPRVKPNCNGVKKPGCVAKQEYDPITGEPLFPFEQREISILPDLGQEVIPGDPFAENMDTPNSMRLSSSLQPTSLKSLQDRLHNTDKRVFLGPRPVTSGNLDPTMLSHFSPQESHVNNDWQQRNLQSKGPEVQAGLIVVKKFTEIPTNPDETMQNNALDQQVSFNGNSAKRSGNGPLLNKVTRGQLVAANSQRGPGNSLLTDESNSNLFSNGEQTLNNLRAEVAALVNPKSPLENVGHTSMRGPLGSVDLSSLQPASQNNAQVPSQVRAAAAMMEAPKALLKQPSLAVDTLQGKSVNKPKLDNLQKKQKTAAEAELQNYRQKLRSFNG